MPLIGDVPLSEIHPRHVRELVDRLKAKIPTNELAPRSVRHVYEALKRMLQRAVDDELLIRNPCNLRKNELPAKVDKNPSWRPNARFDRAEVQVLMSDLRIPEDRRVAYGIIFMTGARIGEVIAARWSDIQDRQPLQCLVLARSWDTKKRKENDHTKTHVAKQPPIHPTLQAMLKQWRSKGWAARYGRPPSGSDLIVPQPLDRARGRRVGGASQRWSADTFRKRCYEDLAVLGFRRRSPHDGRATFISLTMEDGCSPSIMQPITHPSPIADARGGYHRPSWAATCAEMAKYSITLTASPATRGGSGAVDDGAGLATDSVTDSSQAPVIKKKKMEPAGIEPASENKSPKDNYVRSPTINVALGGARGARARRAIR